MTFDLEAHLLEARLNLRRSIRRNAMRAVTDIHFKAEAARDSINFEFTVAEAESDVRRFRQQFSAMSRIWEARK